ncbi:MAG TPA: 4Fe-4S binding protein [Firmicutes bacterium]|nr:4Fe-4S binding protein [Candidatus Fermentithermobacillaceae bacterium]
MRGDIPLAAVDQPGTSRAYHTGAWRLVRPLVQEEKCTGCGLCNLYCPDAAIQVVKSERGSRRVARFNPLYCKGCGICAAECKAGAITMVTEDNAREAAK